MRDVALITCAELPEPDPDETLLVSALTGAGLDAALVAWDDPRAEPEAFRVCVLRSCWNYHERPPEFLAWVQRAAEVTRLVNPAPVVRWNTHKRYLDELARRGVPVVPTEWVDGLDAFDLARIRMSRGWEDVVIKPAISAASFGTRRFSGSDVAAATRHVTDLLATRDVMVQPYLSAVETSGERAIVWIDGALTHVVGKHPRFADGAEAVTAAAAPTPQEAALAEQALARVAKDVLYARVDVVEGPNGDLVVSELELIEPSLFLAQHPPALERLVRAIVRMTEREGR